METFNWTCPFCNRHTTITAACTSTNTHHIAIDSKIGKQILRTFAVVCPNKECRELTIEATLSPYSVTNNVLDESEPQSTWKLRPQANVKQYPNYIPQVILNDYKEACLVLELSPKASATLSRRCMQGMIRDFWKVKKDRLKDEIEGIKDKVDPTCWTTIDALRKIGNIGAHMEKDVNQIIEVDPNEAQLLIELLETLLQEWYVNTYEKNERFKKIIDVARNK